MIILLFAKVVYWLLRYLIGVLSTAVLHLQKAVVLFPESIYLVTNILFCSVFLFSVNFHGSIMLICVLCLFWLSSLTSPFEFFSPLFSSPHVPDFIRPSQHSFCKVHS